MSKKRKPVKKSPRRTNTAAVKIPDRRAMEGVLSQLMGSGGDKPLDLAQQIMYEAFDEEDVELRLALAHKALETSPDCADAYVLLAEHASNSRERLQLFEKAVSAGERALGPKMFKEGVGHFWGILETRPYMRARLGQACALWTVGQRPESVDQLQDMLRLNPGDNQGVRYTLAGYLPQLDRDEDLARLLDSYREDGMAAWAFNHALLAFRRHGDSPDSRRLLHKAGETNKHVLPYLRGQKQPPRRGPATYSPGEDSEAQVYLQESLAAWTGTPGAVEWVRAFNDKQAIASQVASAKQLNRIGQLSQGDDSWQVGYHSLPFALDDAPPGQSASILLVVDGDSEMVLGSTVISTAPTPELVCETLVEIMGKPMHGQPHRPQAVHLSDRALWQGCKQYLENLGIRCVLDKRLSVLDDALEGLLEHLGAGQGDSPPQAGLLESPGITPEQVGRCYAAAAAYHRCAPWRKAAHDAIIKVTCDAPKAGPWYGLVFGQTGLEYGFTLYEDVDKLRSLLDGELSEKEAGNLTAITALFVRRGEFPQADEEAAQKHRWELAQPGLYPWLFRKNRGMSTRPLLMHELALLEACLRAVPDFLQHRKATDPTPETFAATETAITLAWMQDS